MKEMLMTSIEQMSNYFSQGDINRLLPAIIYNNPQDVNENLKSQGLVNYLMEPDELLQWFEDQGNEMDQDSFFNTLDVPFYPYANNVTSGLDQVLLYKMQIDQGANDSGDNIYGTWGEAFGDGINKMYEKYFSSNVRIKSSDSADTTTKPSTLISNGDKKPVDKDKLMSILFIVGLVIITISAFLIFVKYMVKK